MKVTFKHKNGREQIMPERFAKILHKLGRGEYQIGESQIVELAFPGTSDTRTIQQLDAEIKAANAGLSLEQAQLEQKNAEAIPEKEKVKKPASRRGRPRKDRS